MMETEKGKRIEQILATDVTREQLAEALWCAESSQRMWRERAEENRSFRLKAEDENAKLRELLRDMWEYIYIGTAQDGQSLHDRTRDLGIEVRHV